MTQTTRREATATGAATAAGADELATTDDLRSCYRLLFGREPDREGWESWADHLERHPLPAGELAKAFIHSAEFRLRHHLAPEAKKPAAPVPPPQPSRTWKVMRALIASSKEHAFLDRAWIGPLMAVTPRRLRRPLALRLLSLSPHFWVYQWSDRYPAEFRRAAVLEHECARNAASRREICDKLLGRFLRPGTTVLDFGCGPGFLAREVSARVGKVIAADVSRGVIACAKALNPAPNLSYVANRPRDLSAVADSSVDLVYSFAVFQHLLSEQTAVFFREFARVLKPGGRGVFHTILKRVGEEQYTGEPESDDWLEKGVHLRMVYLTADEITNLLGAAGFVDVQITQISSITDINDDIGKEHLVTFRLPTV